MPDALTRRELVAQALFAVLTTALAPIPVERNPRAAVTAAEAPHVALFDGGQTAAYTDMGLVEYRMEFGIEGAVTAANDAGLGPALNALYGRIIRAVMVDPSLGGACIQLTETRLDVTLSPPAESSAPLIFFALGIEAEFHTPDGNPAG